jgi:hypothetical protein
MGGFSESASHIIYNVKFKYRLINWGQIYILCENLVENRVKISPVFQRPSFGASVQPQYEISLQT